jgi:hypothetical protein
VKPDLDAECKADELEQVAAWCQEAIGNVLDTTANKISIHARCKIWWNADIKKRRKAVRREKQRTWDSEEATRVKAELQKPIHQSKRTMWSEYLRNLKGAEVWRAARYANHRPGTTMEAITDRGGMEPNRLLEKQEMVSHEFVPPNDDDQYYELPPAVSSPMRITEQAVE